MKKIYIIAGEPSGDILASRLMVAMRRRNTDMQFYGVGGETMAEQGFCSLFDIKDLSIMGFWEVLPKLPIILKRMQQVMKHIRSLQPDALITIDSWGFVSVILKKLSKNEMNFPKIHYVAPQVWAWKKNRAQKAARLLDHLMTLLPNEPAYFEKHGLSCTFTGHPVVENIAAVDNAPLSGIPAGARILCLLPGSRRNEIRKLAPVFIKVVEQLQTAIPELYLLIPSVAAMRDEMGKKFLHITVPHRIIVGQAARYEAFRISEFALAASGTVSLELTTCGTPHIIAYKFNYITNKLIELLATTRFANIINILANKEVIPEFVLHNCCAELITPVVQEMLHSTDKRIAQISEARQYLQMLQPDENILPSEKAAETVMKLLTTNSAQFR